MPRGFFVIMPDDQIRRGIITMNKYTSLLAKKESGELSILLQLGLPLYLTFWMEICEFHINHPELSQFQVALHFNTSKKTIWRAYHLLE